jgi:hypothetical protein
MQVAQLPETMTAPIHSSVLRISHEDAADLVAKLRVVLGRLGYRVEAANPVRMTVRELAGSLHKKVSTASKALRSPTCPDFVCKKGKRRILWLEPNDRLLDHLQNPPLGGRPTNPADR